MPSSLTLTPAYGRDYTSKVAVQKDWDELKDFKIANFDVKGKYINKTDFLRFLNADSCSIFIRYSKLRKVMEVKNG